jgi:TetR/AcrR family transcriptional repressor of nem operon
MSLEIALEEQELRSDIVRATQRVQSFFQRCLKAAQEDGDLRASESVEDLSAMFLGMWVAVRVIGRSRQSRSALESMLRPALVVLEPSCFVSTTA